MAEKVARRSFGALDHGTAIELITIRNAAGLELSVTNYGCLIVSLCVPDALGRSQNVVLGHDRLEPYLDAPYFGALVGRFANRIANARFSIDGVTHDLSPNEPRIICTGASRDSTSASGTSKRLPRPTRSASGAAAPTAKKVIRARSMWK